MNLNRGTALLTVLWIILLVSIISLTLAASVRVEIGSVTDSFDSEQAFYMAKGAAESLFALFLENPELQTNSPIARDGNGDYVFPLEKGDSHVRLESAAGMIDLNEASDKLLASMFDSVGVSQDERNHLVDSILDWRDADDIPHLYGAEINDYKQLPGQRLPRNAPFESVDELLEVKNMTPLIFNGSLKLDPLTGQYQRFPGVRELVTVDSHVDKVEVNDTSAAVLAAIPQVTPELAQRIITERATKPFKSLDDLMDRLPELKVSPAVQYLTAGNGPGPTAIISRATIRNSGVSRTVRLVFRREQRAMTIQLNPYISRIVTDIKFGHWQF